jgi:hypothetical protein
MERNSGDIVFGLECSYSQEHADQLCNLVCKDKNRLCQDNHKRGCWSWTRIDSFKRILLAHKYKND